MRSSLIITVSVDHSRVKQGLSLIELLGELRLCFVNSIERTSITESTNSILGNQNQGLLIFAQQLGDQLKVARKLIKELEAKYGDGCISMDTTNINDSEDTF